MNVCLVLAGGVCACIRCWDVCGSTLHGMCTRQDQLGSMLIQINAHSPTLSVSLPIIPQVACSAPMARFYAPSASMVCDVPLHFDYSTPVATAFVPLSAAAQGAGSLAPVYPFAGGSWVQPDTGLASDPEAQAAEGNKKPTLKQQRMQQEAALAAGAAAQAVLSAKKLTVLPRGQQVTNLRVCGWIGGGLAR